MTNAIPTPMTSAEAARPAQRSVADLGAEIAHLETCAAASAIGARQVREEISTLEGFTVGGVLSALFGQKAASLERLREQLDYFQNQEAQSQATIIELRKELA